MIKDLHNYSLKIRDRFDPFLQNLAMTWVKNSHCEAWVTGAEAISDYQFHSRIGDFIQG
jgi:hypothetical protein